jgi:glycosyltransferase involved in cell wall biosynthesis
MADNVALSVVLPVYNEAGGIVILIREIVDVLVSDFNIRSEIVVVDDASEDGSATIVETATGPIANRYPGNTVDIRVVRQPGHSGQSRALMAGFAAARGDLIVSMDADGQYDPRDIPRFLDAMKKCEMVCGIRRTRSDGIVRKVCSVIANRVRNTLTGDSIADAGCTFRMMRKECLPALQPLDGRLDGCEFFFHPLALRKKGFRVGEIRVTHRPRAAGKSNYRLVRGRMMRGLKACVKAGWLLQGRR